MKKLMSILLVLVFLFTSVFAPWQPARAETVTVKIENDDSRVVYVGDGWTHETSGTADQSSGKSHHYTFGAGDYAELTFTGTSIKVYGKKGPLAGLAYFYIDDMENPLATVNTKGGHEYQVLFFEKTDLAPGEHTIRVQNDVTGNAFNLDFFLIEYEEEPEVDKTDLIAKIAEAEGLNEEDYTEESWAVFEAALTVAQNVADNDEATQEEVDDALEALINAIDALEEKPEEVVDKTALNAKIAEAEELNEVDYTEESWAVLADALADAEYVAADEDASQEEVDNALLALESAIEGLVVKSSNDGAYIRDFSDGVLGSWRFIKGGGQATLEVENEALKYTKSGTFVDAIAIDDISPDIADGEFEVEFMFQNAAMGFEIVFRENGDTYAMAGYSGNTGWVIESHDKWEDLVGPQLETNKVYTMKVKYIGTNVELYIDDTQIYSGDISPKVPNLPTGAGKIGLRTKYGDQVIYVYSYKVTEITTEPEADKAALIAKIAEAEELNEANYTEESWSAFENALNNARTIAEKEDATQEEVDNALSALESAIEGLVEVVIKEIVSITTVNVITVAGTAPELPDKVEVTYSDESTGEVDVTWDSIDESRYAQAGQFTVEGTVEGTELKAVATVEVIEIPYYMIDFEDNQPGDWAKVVGNATIETQNGMLKVIRDTSANNMVVLVDNGTPGLSNGEIEIMFRLDNEASRFGVVFRTGTEPNNRWGFAGYSVGTNWLIETGTGAGEQWIDDISGPALQVGRTYVMKVRFQGTTITIWLDGQQVYSGDVSYKLTNLPTGEGKIGLRSWYDQKTAWIEYIKYGEIDSIPEVASLETINVSTVEGIAPALPGKIMATYTDGTSTMVPVVWDTINPALYADEGTFSVEGSVPGTNIKAITNVTVTPAAEVFATLKGAEYAVLGEDYTVTFGVDSEVSLAALDVTITYDPNNFEFVDVNSVLDGAVIAGYNADEPGIVHVLIGTEGEQKAIDGEKDVFAVTLKPIKAFVSDTISAVDIQVSDGDGFVIYPDGVSLTVAMEGERIPGDVNGDGEINIGDVGIAARYYGYSEEDEDWSYAKKADVIVNGKVDIEDLVFIAKKLLNIE